MIGFFLLTALSAQHAPPLPGREPFSRVEERALEQLSESNARHHGLVDAWYKGRAVQHYDFGRTEPQPGTLYRVRGGGDVLTTVPGLPGYSALRQVYEVSVVSPEIDPRSLRDHQVVRALARQGRVRLIGTGLTLSAPVVPAGSTLEHDPAGRVPRPAWYRDRLVHYFDFGATRAVAVDLVAFTSGVRADGTPAPVEGHLANLTRIPGEPGYGDLCDLWIATVSPRAPPRYRDAQRALADGRAGRLTLVRPGVVNACPVVYVDGRPAPRPGPTPVPADALSAARLASAEGVTAGVTQLDPASPAATTGTTAFTGTTGNTTVPPPRLDASVVVDGILNEPVWAAAAMLNGFSQFRPLEGRPSEDSTQVRVWYSPIAIHFGVRAFAPTGTVRASLADRDKITGDDYIEILLDTFNDRRQALAFEVNPLGAQADGIRTEGGGQVRAGGGQPGGGGGGQPGTGGGGEGFERNLDLSPDFVFESKGRLTDFGYEIEMLIPFKSLRYQSSKVQDWGINVLRKVQRSGFEDTWTRTARSASFLSQSGRLQGLAQLQRGLVLDLNPVLTARIDGAPSGTGAGWQYQRLNRHVAEIGGNVRWGMTTNLTLTGTVNPDFSQIEADAAQLPPDPRFAVFFPEKRPFFVEGIEQLNAPGQLIYTRQVTNPIGSVKLTGKAAGTNIGILSAVDSRNASRTLGDRPVYNLARLRRDLPGQSTLGLTYTDKVDGGDYNRVIALDTRIVFQKLYFVALQVGQSFTRIDGVRVAGPLWDVWADRAGRHFGYLYRVQGFHRDFQALSGFIRRTGIVTANFTNRLSLYGARGGLFESWTGRFSVNGTWDYDGFFQADGPIETRTSLQNTFTFRGGWSVGLNPTTETFAFDSAFHAGYTVERRLPSGVVDTIPFVFHRTLRTAGVIANLTTPKFSSFSGSLNVVYGREIEFFESAPSTTFSTTAIVDWRPTGRVRINAQFSHRDYRRKRDGTTFSTANVPRLKLEYQLSRAVFIRFVGQYDARTRDGLRDPRTEEPILIADSLGTNVLTTRTVTNDLRIDALFSYQPNPGTVIFAGYGSSLTETDAFTFRDLGRVQDGFFVKLSYLFRVE